MSEMILTQQVKMDMMTALKAATKPFNTATVILFKNDVVRDDQRVIGDFVECTFGGYAAVAAVAFGNVFLGTDRRITLVAPSIEFQMTDLTSLDLVKGYAVVKADKSVVYGFERFDTPIQLSVVGQGFTIEPKVRYGD